jgi:hypothetical protein
MNNEEKKFADQHEALHAMHEHLGDMKRQVLSLIDFGEIADRTQYMSLSDLSELICTLKRALLCTEALEDIDEEDLGRTEAHCQYFTALDHLGLAATAMKMAHIKYKKGE